MSVPVFLLAAIHFLLACDFTMVYLALPGLALDAGLAAGGAQWVMHGYAVAFGGFMLASGRAADLFGARRVLVAGLVVLAAGSLLGGASSSGLGVICARFVQGAGAAMAFPSMLAIIGQRRAGDAVRATAVWSAAGPCGLAAGTALGGLIVDSAGWRWVFYLNIPLAGVFAAAALRFFGPDAPRVATRLGLANAATGATALALLIGSLVMVPASGWLSPEVAGAGALALLLFHVFARLERNDPQPLLPRSLLRSGDIVLCMVQTGGIMGTFMALPYFQTQLYQRVFALTALEAGLAFLAPCLAQAVGARLSEPVARRLGVHMAITSGLCLGAGGLVAAAIAASPAASIHALWPWLSLAALGQGVAWSATWVLAGSAAPPDQQGSASGLVSTAFQVGGALGLSLLVLGTFAILGVDELDAQVLPAAHAVASSLAAAVIAVLAAVTARRWHVQRRQWSTVTGR